MEYVSGALVSNEQQQGLPFVRFLFPSDADRVAQAMTQIIRDRYKLDWINPAAWGAVGIGGDAVFTFLRRLMLYQRSTKTVVDEANRFQYESYMSTKYGYSQKLSEQYFDAYLEVVNAGLVPNSILKPWTYTPSSPIVQWVVIGLSAVAVYAAVSKGVPAMLKK
jgi:hypothetical protein